MRRTIRTLTATAASITGVLALAGVAGATTPATPGSDSLEPPTTEAPASAMVRPILKCSDPLGTAISIPDLTGLSVPDLTGFTLPELTGFTLPDLTGFTLPDLTGFTLPDLTGFTLPDLSGVTLPDLSGVTLPDLSGVTIPDGLPSLSNDPTQPATHLYIPGSNLSSMTMCEVGPTDVLGTVFEANATATPNPDGTYGVDLTLRPGADGADLYNALAAKCFAGDATCPAKELAVELGSVIIARIPVTSVDAVTTVRIPGPFSEEDATAGAKSFNESLAASVAG